MKKLVLILTLIVTIGLEGCYSISTQIRGTITDADNGKVLSNVSVVEKGTTNYTTSNNNGEYAITVTNANSVLVFSFPGKEVQEITVGSKKTIDVALTFEILKTEYDKYRNKEELYEINTRSKRKENRNDRPKTNKSISSYSGSNSPVITKNSHQHYDDRTEINHNTEAYDKINENNFKVALEEPVSTFSVDVDNASYANLRRFLNNSQLPPKDAVRIEEMINYFDYKYKAPDGQDPFSINMEMGKCFWNDKHYLVQVGLKGKEVPVEKIPPSNLVFLIDVSGSMSANNKLPLLKSAFKILMEKLRAQDRVSIVVYAGAAGLVLKSTPCNQKDKITTAFDKLQSGGSTAGGQGIELAYKIAKENFIKEGNNRVILATDGDFNVGQSSDGHLVRMIEEKRKDGVFLTVLGFGMGNYKDSKMEKLSNAGNGNYAYIDNILEAKKVLGKEMWGTLFTIAKDVKIQIEFNPAKVKAYRLIGYENRLLNKEDFNDDTKDAGDIGSGHTVTAFYEIIPANSDETIKGSDKLEYQTSKIIKSDDLMKVKLRYKQPDGNISKLIEQKVNEKDIKTKNLSENFRFASAVVEFGLLLRNSKHKGTSSYNHVKELAKKAKGQDREDYRAEFIKLVETAELIEK